MSLSIYFAKPLDTPIAETNPAFIEALKHSAAKLAVLRVTRDPNRADVVVVDEKYRYRTWHYIDELESCPFLRRHAARLCVVNHDDHARVFLPGLYVSLEGSRPPLVDAAPIPYKHDLWRVPVPVEFEFQPQRLFTFRGNLHSHPVRRKLYRILNSTQRDTCKELHKDLHSHDESDQRGYIADIKAAAFSLCPRGLSPSTYRLYESMQLGRSPVVIADDWIPPPGPDWRGFALFVRQAELRSLHDLLEREAESAEAYGRRAMSAWRSHFSWPRRYDYFLERVAAFHEGREAALRFRSLHDIWTSLAFRKLYGWTLYGRAKQFLRRHTLRLGDRLRFGTT